MNKKYMKFVKVFIMIIIGYMIGTTFIFNKHNILERKKNTTIDNKKREAEIAGYKLIIIDNIHYYYSNETDKADIEIISKVIEKWSKKMDIYFGEEINENLKVVIEKEFNNISDGNFIGGYFSENRILNIKNKKEFKGMYDNSFAKELSQEQLDKNYEGLIAHEYAHYRTIDLAAKAGYNGGGLPNWFNEGIGYYFEMLAKEEEIDGNASLNGKKLSMYEVNIDPALYLPAASFIKYLTLNYEESVLGNIITKYNNNNFEETIDIVLGRELNDLCNKIYGVDY